jgi:MarR family transcriptional regulator, 2-MHQ and catechol-resistance regulon repressor
MPTHFQGTRPQRAALEAYIKLIRCAESLTARLQPNLEQHGLTVSQFGVLEALLHLGPLPASVLAQKILKSGGNLTMVVRNLERSGLVRRKRDANDRRFFAIHLTSKGTRLVEQAFRGHLERLMEEMAVLTTAEQEQLAALCKKLGKAGS